MATLPQLLAVLIERTLDLSGMSPARWYVGAASCASWTAYGWLLGLSAVWLSAGFGLVCAVATGVVLRTRRTTAPVALVLPLHPPAAPRTALAAA